jgi:hypothetical protein
LPGSPERKASPTHPPDPNRQPAISLAPVRGFGVAITGSTEAWVAARRKVRSLASGDGTGAEACLRTVRTILGARLASTTAAAASQNLGEELI